MGTITVTALRRGGTYLAKLGRTIVRLVGRLARRAAKGAGAFIMRFVRNKPADKAEREWFDASRRLARAKVRAAWRVIEEEIYGPTSPRGLWARAA